MGDRDIGYQTRIKASAEQFDPQELVELAVAAEQHGLDSATVSDNLQPWRAQGGHAPFSLAWKTAVGERTSRIQLGTSVLTPTFRYNPAVIAQAFAILGCLHPERIMLGVSTSEALNEIATGYKEERPGLEPALRTRIGDREPTQARDHPRLHLPIAEPGEQAPASSEYTTTHDGRSRTRTCTARADSSAASTMPNGTIRVNSPRCPGANCPAATD